VLLKHFEHSGMVFARVISRVLPSDIQPQDEVLFTSLEVYT
jgi:hypothetical protein